MLKKKILFRTKNKFGREGRRRTKIRWREPSREMYRRIACFIKASRHPLVKTTADSVLTDASWIDTQRITSMIHKYLPQIKIDQVKAVNNPFLNYMYELKKEEYISRSKTKHGVKGAFGDTLQELELFHCTSQFSVSPIAEDNLTWRVVRRARFGTGNCFSSDAEYANCHANRHIGEARALIVCKVLVQRKILGSAGLEIPPKGYDTTTGGRTNQIVYVKYYDNEFIPLFVAYYKCDYSKDVFGSKYNNMPSSWF